MSLSVRVKVHSSLYIRDPEETELGKMIVSDSIKLIDQIGFEEFTFKKLATKIKSTEASIYRYFRNKGQLLAYLVSWYWNWLEYLIEYRTTNIDDPRKCLEIALGVLTDSCKYDPNIPHIDESILHHITIEEGARVYMTKQSDKISGLLQGYENLCTRLLRMVKALSPRYKYANELVTSIIAAVHNQVFYAEHGSATMKGELKNVDKSRTLDFLKHLVFTSIDA